MSTKRPPKKYIEIQRHGVTEAQFRACIRSKLRNTALDWWRSWITPELGHGTCEYREAHRPDGTVECNKDLDGEYQTCIRDANGNGYNLIFEFTAHDDDGRGHGYFYLYDDNAKTLDV